MPTYGNTAAVPLSIAVFLATDNYDYNDNPDTISVTTLLKPLRQIILASRVDNNDATVDLAQMVPNRMGNAIHDAIERAWVDNYQVAMKSLGYPDRVISQIKINPKPEELTEDCLPIYLEQRTYRKMGRYTISGKFDFVGDGRPEDFKSTSAYTWIYQNNDEKYVWQGSLYRWLNPTIITRDEMAIQFIFTDWSRSKAMMDPKYPQDRIQQKIFKLKSIAETEAFISNKLSLIETYWDMPEEDIPHCTDAELWRSEPVFKYYKNPEKTTRSTKNFDSLHDARLRLIEDGSVGMIKEVPGQVNACKYCSSFSICSQKDALIANGDLLMG
jgi:hypothetical protein